ncbi:MAG TPA: hypothetical protein VFS21_02640 [Roseiflexaceae bacterium]|nr:hypothetical protein [Roseiflexaceae bacterium]
MTTKRFADDINDAAARAARLGLQTRIDLDAFLALDSTTRAARWRGWDVSAKADAVMQMLGRKSIEWSEELVAAYIEMYDAKWGGELTQTERAVAGALELLADQAAGRADSPTATAAQRAEAQAEARQIVSAQREFLGGRRAVEVERGVWSVPSATRPGQVYQVQLGEQAVCSCPRRSSGCWHVQLASATERAPDLIHDPAPIAPALLPPAPHSTSTLSTAPADEPTLGGVPLRAYEGDAPRAQRRAQRWAA